MIRSLLLSLLTLSFLVMTSYQAQAGQPRLLGSYGKWDAYVFFENDEKVCYMASQPTDMKGDYKRRGEAFALITHRPADRTRDVFSYITGYTYKSGGEAEIVIDGQSYKLYTQDETAWGPDGETDRKLAEAIKNGSNMIVKGTSSRGTDTTDTLSLKGSSAAYKRISSECR